MAPVPESSIRSAPDVPLTLLSSYLFFLLRRPVSSSNRHYLARRLKGLQSLAGLLELEGSREIQELAGRLRRLTPENFSRLSGALQLELAAAQRSTLTPLSFVVSRHQPPRWPLTARRLLLIFGPAIGIGDEIILFPLPAAIRAAYGDIEIVLMSGYRGLWDQAPAVNRLEYYETHAELIEALAGRSLGSFDAVIFADFEKPGLTPSICVSPAMRTWIEISLGGQCAVFADTRSRRIHSAAMPIEARANYYEVADWLIEWLGVPANRREFYAEMAAHSDPDTSRPFRIFVSPFTSKHEPSLLYWSRILSALASVPSRRDLEFVLDSGANPATARFAASVLRSTRPVPGGRVRFRIASDPDSRTVGLSGALEELKNCDLVVCADSFAAHAGPLFGCATMVMARAGLENWRTPFERSFYFDTAEPLEEVQSAMTAIFQELLEPSPRSISQPPEGAALDAATIRLRRVLDPDRRDTAASLDGHYDAFKTAYDAMSRMLPDGCGCPPGLLGDADYRRNWPNTGLGAVDEQDEHAMRHLRVELGRWENTNLRKFLRLRNG